MSTNSIMGDSLWWDTGPLATGAPLVEDGFLPREFETRVAGMPRSEGRMPSRLSSLTHDWEASAGRVWGPGFAGASDGGEGAAGPMMTCSICSTAWVSERRLVDPARIRRAL